MRDRHPRNPLHKQIGVVEMLRFWFVKRRTERMVKAKRRSGEWHRRAA
jgi:hypothetical protein